MKAWKAALAAAVATAAIAVIVVAPLAQSSESRARKTVKIVTVTKNSATSNVTTAKCPRGFVAIGGGFRTNEVVVTQSEKLDTRRWRVEGDPDPLSGKRGTSADAQAVCAKGTGGLDVVDAGLRGGGKR